jgi:hypothetical protein
MDDPSVRPYFLWSENTTVAELHAILDDPENPARSLYLARLMREATVEEVWKFVTPAEVAAAWPQVQVHLGRRRRFWRFLLDTWKAHGAI